MTPMSFKGRWVLITGASSGLGCEMAHQLALQHGANLVIVARRQERLEQLQRDLESKAGIQVVPIRADLSELSDVDRVMAEATRGRSLYAAILNAGVTHFGGYSSLSWESFQRMLNTNVTSVVRLTTELVPHIEQHAPGGGVMLVASMAGITPVPYQTAYSGTKAFLVHFGCGLWHELQGRNVSITTFAPGGVVTEMTGGESFVPLRRWLMPVDKAASDGIDAFRRRKYLHVSGAANRLGSAFLPFLPRRLVTTMVASSYRKALKLTKQL